MKAPPSGTTGALGDTLEAAKKSLAGKPNRLLVGVCPGCLQPKPAYFRGICTSPDTPVNIFYDLCKPCTRRVQRPRTRLRTVKTIEENIEALGAYDTRTAGRA